MTGHTSAPFSSAAHTAAASGLLGGHAAAAGLAGAGCGLGLLLIAAGLRPNVGAAGSPHSPLRAAVSRWNTDRLLLRVAIAGAAAVGVGLLTGWPVAALLAAAAALTLPTLLAGGRHRTRDIALIEAVAGWTEMLRDTLAGAAGLEQAITATAPVAPTAIRRPVADLALALERGRRLPAALRDFADEVADPTCDLVVAALLLAAEHQSRRLADLLGTLATAAREQASLRLRTEAGRARSRTSVRVIIGVTSALTLALLLLNRGYLSPYDSAGGQLMLLLVGGLFAAAFGWLAQMTKPRPPARLLSAPPTFDGAAMTAALGRTPAGAGALLEPRGQG
jgi:tight adherence protein B